MFESIYSNPCCRQQIHNAVIYQRMLQKFASVSEDPPSWRQLAAVGFATGLPFVVFGILDNGIMVGAGTGSDAYWLMRPGLIMSGLAVTCSRFPIPLPCCAAAGGRGADPVWG